MAIVQIVMVVMIGSMNILVFLSIPCPFLVSFAWLMLLRCPVQIYNVSHLSFAILVLLVHIPLYLPENK
ncbi:hypothetical protein F5890DRAFT_893270 [Lentinula detonsa]|uniref:Uncharacterized protein n=1 Tax=Lentinula detonsa TaxID=2804962 RepID=A0AA38Q4P1_9AGAR|nr:hypothetical protein F5890DRAFT_893270 [Lentinula detonsa]